MTITPVVLIEDHGLLALSISSSFRENQALLQPYELDGPVQLVASGRSLVKWLDTQPKGSVRLLVMDYSIVGGEGSAVLKTLREQQTGAPLHPALHANVWMIGWSAELSAAEAFQMVKTDGFISKHRPIERLVRDIIAVIDQRRAGEEWVEIV